MCAEDAEKTALSAQCDLFDWKVTPMGLNGAPCTFQRLMYLVLTGLNWQGVLVYLDDLLINGSNYQEHYKNLKEVLERFRVANLKLS